MLCRILLAVSWSWESDCAKTADTARNRMGTDVNGLVNTIEPVANDRGWNPKELSFPDRSVDFLKLLKCGIHLIRFGLSPSPDEMIQ